MAEEEEAADDRAPLSPGRRPGGRIVAGKSFEQLLEEAVSKKRGKRKKKKNKKALLENQFPRSDGDVGATENLPMHSLGHVNPAAQFSQEELRPAQSPRAARKPVLAPIRPPRNLRSPLNVLDASERVDDPKRENQQEESVAHTTPIAVSPVSTHSKHSAVWQEQTEAPALLPGSPAKSPVVSSSGAASSLNSTPDKRPAPEAKKRRRRLQTDGRERSIEMSELGRKETTPAPHPVRSPSGVGSSGLLGVTIHLCEVPLATAPAAGFFLRAHAADVETGSELRLGPDTIVGSRDTGLVSRFRGRMASVEQTLAFDAPLQLALENNVVLLFEIFVPRVSNYSSCYAKIDVQERCVGWAFLKLRSSTGLYNTDARLRLQIYEPLGLPKFTPAQNLKTVHGWWSKGPWKKTKCSVFVTVTGVESGGAQSRKSSAGGASGDVADARRGDRSSEKITHAGDSSISPNKQFLDQYLKRGESHLCKMTDKLFKSLSPASFNCLSASFSESGCFLAAASNQTINIYKDVCNFKCALEGHDGLVYSVSWGGDELLVSASADCLAIVWDVTAEAMLRMLPHPSFVYCAAFVPGRTELVVTGGKDKTLRVWNKTEEDGEFDLWQELDGHQGFVTALRFAGAETFYSSDSEGVVLGWLRRRRSTGGGEAGGTDWRLQREYLVPELRGVSVCGLAVHPSGRRLFVYARDSVVRTLDAVSGVVLQSCHGALAHKIQSGLCLSPCGALLLAGSEDGTVVAWQADTGKVVGCVAGIDLPPATALAYHPRAHVLAVGHFGHSPINIWVPGANEMLMGATIAVGRESTLTSGGTIAGQGTAEHLRLQDIIARIDRVLLTQTETN